MSEINNVNHINFINIFFSIMDIKNFTNSYYNFVWGVTLLNGH